MRLLSWMVTVMLLLAGPVAAAELAIVGARIYPSPDAEPIAEGTVVVRDGRIVAVGPSSRVRPGRAAQVIDGRGKVVMAGFWNAHVHLMSPAMSQPAGANAAALEGELEAMLTRWGFTSVFDTGSRPGEAVAVGRRIAAGQLRGPNILSVDAPFYPNGGMPNYVREISAGLPSFEVGDPTRAALRARRQLAEGASGVKIFAGSIVGPPVGVLPMPLDAAQAVVNEAHRAGKVAFAHPSDLAGLNVAIDSNVDILAHTTPDGGMVWTSELIARLRAHNMALVPTLTLWGVELRREGAPQAAIDRMTRAAQAQLKAYSDAGGQILFGTDVGYTDAFDTTEEYRLMAGAGLTFRQILASLTTAPAQRFRFPRKGKVAPGMDADLTVLSADPATDAAAFARVACTVRAGRVIFSAR